jgi:predicted GIY-YIG superfamily endonuclease
MSSHTVHYEYLREDFTTIKEMYKHCIDCIMELKKTRHFYIGFTTDPSNRLDVHIEERNMGNMFILVKTHTQSQSIKLEQRLIKRFNSTAHTNRCLNQGGGGEGITGDGYIYLLLR